MSNEPGRKGNIIVVSGFSGAGKGSLMKNLLSRYEGYELSVSMTTRKPREGEVHGREYFFTTDEEFERLIKEDKFIEHAGYCGHYYGTPRAFVEEKLDAGSDVLLEIEVQGALQVRKVCPQAVLLFIMTPSVDELKRRLRKRGTESEEVIARRISQAKVEVGYVDQYDYLLINDDLDRCTEEMHQVIRASHASPSRNLPFIASIATALENE